MSTFTSVPPRTLRAGREGPGRPRLGRSQDAIGVALGTWLVLGAFLDGWAHTNLRVDTVLTPWHAVLYSGFLATAGYTLWIARRACRPPGRWPDSIPAGQGLALAGVVVFGIGAVADQAWHAVFGIERDVAALLSPTHVLLFSGAMLILSAPLRAAWEDGGRSAPSLRTFAPVLASVALTTAVAAFAFMYLSPFRRANYGTGVAAYTQRVTWGPGAAADYQANIEIVGMASILVTTVVYVAPVLLVLRRWRPPFGSVAILWTAVTVAVAGIDAFHSWPLVLAAPAAGLAVDVLIRRLHPSPADPWAFRAVAAIAPLTLWLAFFAVYQAAYGVGWKAELWAGTTTMSALVGLGASVLVVPPVEARRFARLVHR